MIMVVIDLFHIVRYCFLNNTLSLYGSYDCMYLCLIITIDRERSILLITVNTFRACVYFAANVGKLSYLVIVLMRHTMVVNIQFYFLSLDLITRWLTRDIG